MLVSCQHQRACHPSAVLLRHPSVIGCCCLLPYTATRLPVLQLVPAPCDPSKAADISFDASSSRDGSGRPLTRFRWAAPGSNDVVLKAAVSAANAAAGGAGAVKWVQTLKLSWRVPPVLQLPLSAVSAA